jgi:hypothetical protein
MYRSTEVDLFHVKINAVSTVRGKHSFHGWPIGFCYVVVVNSHMFNLQVSNDYIILPAESSRTERRRKRHACMY